MMIQYAIVDEEGVVSGFTNITIPEAPPEVDGKQVIALENPVPYWPEPEFPGAVLLCLDGSLTWRDDRLIEPMRAAAIVQMYADVDSVYDAAIGRRATEYARAESDARAFVTANFKGEASEYVAGFARRNPTGKAQTNQWAAEQIIARVDAFKLAELAMRSTRFDRQADMRAADTIAELVTAVAAWDGFIAALRAQLGV